MNKFSTLALAAFFAQSLAAQTIDRQVIGSAGMVGSTGSVEALANVGEAATITVTNGNFELTQGFEQPDAKSVGTGAATKTSVAFSVFPNPAGHEISVEIAPEAEVELDLQIFSADGRLVTELESGAAYPAGKTRKSFLINELSSGEYFLSAIDRSGKPVKTLAFFKI